MTVTDFHTQLARRIRVLEAGLIVVSVLLVATIIAGVYEVEAESRSFSSAQSARVQRTVDREIAARSATRSRQLCKILSALPRAPLTDAVRHSLRCEASTPVPTSFPTPQPNGTPLPLTVVHPGPTVTAHPTAHPTVTRTVHMPPSKPPMRHHPPTSKPRPTQSCAVTLIRICVPKN